MIKLTLKGTQQYIFNELAMKNPKGLTALGNSKLVNGSNKGRILPYQALAMYSLVKQYNAKTTTILEIGTLYGYSTTIIAQAAPRAKIITLNPAQHEVPIAIDNLKRYSNVDVLPVLSWDFLIQYTGMFDVIFVDGDHNRIAKDIPWWDRVKPNGLMLFHDYNRLSSYRVYNAVNDLCSKLGRKLDICIIDENETGLAGIYNEAA